MMRDRALARNQQQPAPPITNEPEPEPGQVLKPVPVQTFYMNKTQPVRDLAAYVAELRMDMGKNIPAFLQKYDNIKLKAFSQAQGDTENLFNLMKPSNANYDGKQQYVLVGTRNMGIPGQEYEEIIGSLPVDRKQLGISAAMYQYLDKNFGYGRMDFEVPISKSTLIRLVNFRYANSETKANPPILVKQEGANLSLADLKGRYGKHYPHLFSKVYAITDTRNGRFATNSKGEPMGDRMVGRSVIFYAKFPDSSRTVDQMLLDGSQNPNLGYIPLDEGVAFSDIDGLLAHLQITESSDPSRSGRMLLSDNILDKLFNGIYRNKNLSSRIYNSNFKEMLNQVINRTTDSLGNAVVEVTSTKVNRQLFMDNLGMMANDPVLRDAINDAMNDPRLFPNGVYISPTIVSSARHKQDSISEVEQSGAIEDILYNKLSINNFGFPVVSLPNFELGIDSDMNQREREFAELFREEKSNPLDKQTMPSGNLMQINNDGSGMDLLPRYDRSVGVAVDPSVAAIIKPFSRDYGITAYDLQEFVSNEISPLVMNENSNNFTQSIVKILDDYAKNC